MEALLHSLAAITHEPMLFVDQTLRILAASHSASRLLNIDPLVGVQLERALDLPEAIALIGSLFNTGVPIERHQFRFQSQRVILNARLLDQTPPIAALTLWEESETAFDLRRIIEAMRDIVLIVDSESRYMQILTGAPELLYVAADQVIADV